MFPVIYVLSSSYCCKLVRLSPLRNLYVEHGKERTSDDAEDYRTTLEETEACARDPSTTEIELSSLSRDHSVLHS